MNRREMGKIVAAAAAGSVAGKAASPDRDLAARRWVEGLNKGFERGYRKARRWNEIEDCTFRLQQAIELGDRTAEDLGALFDLRRHSYPTQQHFPWPDRQPRWGARISIGPKDNLSACWDPDPLTAVQKAREAALKWRSEHEQA